MDTPVQNTGFEIGQVFEGGYPPEAAIWCNQHGAYIEEQEDGSYIIVAVPKPTLEEAKRRKLEEIQYAADDALAPLSAEYPYKEVLSFASQEAEARAVLKDPSTPTPLLTPMAARRGITVEDLAKRIIAKADAATAATGDVLGQAQRDRDRLAAAQTIEDVNAIVPSYELPKVKK